MANKLPWRIQAIVDQSGGHGLRGAFAYVGGHEFCYNERQDEGTPDQSKVDEAGWIKYDTGLQFKVNGKCSQTWKIIITLEPSDTYTVRLVKVNGIKTLSKTGKAAEVLDTAEDVYCDPLQDVIESLYDEAIKKHCDGFIPLH